MSIMKARKPEPSVIEYDNMRFLITDRPTDANMPKYIEELKKHHVKDVVRVCEPTYDKEQLEKHDIHIKDLEFDDGSAPSKEICDNWFELLRSRFFDHDRDRDCCVAVHCVAGLGRAPVLVAIALMERGMKYEDAVASIRQKRRGAINARQLEYLQKYRPKQRLKMKKKCIIQ